MTQPIDKPRKDNPPEADKLLRQALEVWDNITGATRTTINAPAAMGSIRTYLEGKNA